jgi:polysaccharide biosynthesis protein PslG
MLIGSGIQPGISAHLTETNPAELNQMKASGFSLVRTDLLWHQIERQPGCYDFSPYDRLIQAMRQRGLTPWLILGGNNPLYTQPPKTGETRGLTHAKEIHAFTRFVDAVTRHYAGQGMVWELWNEPNHPLFWQPRPQVRQYIRLAQAVLPVMRQNDPSSTIIAPATSGSPVAFIQACLESDLLRWADGVSLHSYQAFYPTPPINRPPELAIPDIQTIRQLLQVRGLGHKHIMLGEWGYSTADMPEAQQAAYAARQYLVALFCQNPVNIWYDWQDDGPNPTDKEDRFGLRRQNLTPKPRPSQCQLYNTRFAGLPFYSPPAPGQRQ